MKTTQTPKQSSSEIDRNIGEKTAYNDPKTGQFIPGNPGKPIGTKHLSTQLMEMLFEKPEGSKDTHGTLLNKRVLKKAISDGDMAAIHLIYDRIEGKPDQTLDVTSDNKSIVEGLAQQIKTLIEEVKK